MRLNKIPKGWEVVSLGDNRYFEILPSGVKEFKGKKLYLSTKCIERNRIVNVESEITFSNRPSRANMQPVVNSVWFAKMKNTIKVYAFTEENSEEAEKYILSTGFCGIKCKEKITTKYLEQFFMSDFFNKLKDSLVTGSTQQDIKNKIVAKIPIILPSLKEREEIVNVLSTIDKAIQKVDEIIAKTERLKKGLMQKLLTKGIGHKEFRDTKIGRIPKEWEVTRLGDSRVAELIMGQSPPSSSYNTHCAGLPFLQGKAEFGHIYPEPKLYTTQPSKVAEKNDILISVRAPVGDVNLCPFKLCIGRGLAAIRIKNGSHLFYFYWFLKTKKFIENLGKGSTFKAITKDELENIFIPLPPLQEQQKIAEILSTIDEKLELERKRKEKLERIKIGLMNDLLIGKIRITQFYNKN